jgi:diacylglycerol O-acyltransferase / wax synthase
MADREKMSGVDTAWLRMDRPDNLMMIVGAMRFPKPLKVTVVRRIIAERLLAYPRFQDRVVQLSGIPFWEHTKPDLRHHVQSATAAVPTGDAALADFVSDLAASPLDPEHPLWQFHLVKLPDGTGAMIARIHHCYADGIALIRVMLGLTGDSCPASLAPPPPVARDPNSVQPTELPFGMGSLPGPLAFIAQQIPTLLEQAMKSAEALASHGAAALSSPQQSLADASTLAIALSSRTLDFGREVTALATLGPDAATQLKGELGTAKRCTWAPALPLAEVKAIGKAVNASINDVLVALVTAALRRYVAQTGDDPQSAIRAVIPVNLRRDDARQSLGNEFGLVFLDLPTDFDHPLERVFEVKRRMGTLKRSQQPMIAYGLLHLVGLGPANLQESVGAMLARSASLVLTNVPGPAKTLYFAGEPIIDQNFWVPQSGQIGLGLSILSYDGAIRFGIMADAKRMPDPELLADFFVAEYERLLWLTLMSPWGDEWESAMSV